MGGGRTWGSRRLLSTPTHRICISRGLKFQSMNCPAHFNWTQSPELCSAYRWKIQVFSSMKRLSADEFSWRLILQQQLPSFISSSLPPLSLDWHNLFFCNSTQIFNPIHFPPIFFWNLINLWGAEVHINTLNIPNLILHYNTEMIISNIYYFILPLCHHTIPSYDMTHQYSSNNGRGIL